LVLRVAHIHLHEGAGQLLGLPRRRHFAAAQSHDHVPDPHRLARLQRQVLADAVALVEQAQHCGPLGHRRGPGRQLIGGRPHRLGRRLLLRRGFLSRLVAAAAGQHERQRQRPSP
jgi:hypothetical protein